MLGWWEHQCLRLRLFLQSGGFKACSAVKGKMGFRPSEAALSCCSSMWGWGGGLQASPAWLSPLPDGRGVHWVPCSWLCDLLLSRCKAQPPSRLWERDSFPLQGWLPTKRGRAQAAGRQGGRRLWRTSLEGAGPGLLPAPSGSQPCSAAVPCAWVLLADTSVLLPTPATACGS